MGFGTLGARCYYSGAGHAENVLQHEDSEHSFPWTMEEENTWTGLRAQV